MSKHTPGPWLLNNRADGFITVHAPTRPNIGTVLINPYCEAECNANARLIAAAPKLLAASKEAQCACSVPERLSGHRVECWMPELLEVIAEAEGR